MDESNLKELYLQSVNEGKFDDAESYLNKLKELKETKKLKDMEKMAEEINLNDLLIDDVKIIMNLPLVMKMSIIDWGKTMAVPNQYIHQSILRHNYQDYNVYTTDDDDFPLEYKNNIKNNSPGYDILMIHKLDGRSIRVQSKLRQVKGKTDTSQQTGFETTRRNSEKNKNKNQTGHIAYSDDEFDYVMISLINVKNNLDKRNNCNLWTYCMINTKDIINHETGCCKTQIPSDTLKKNIINPQNCSIEL